MFELHIFLLFYSLSSQQYACGTWKPEDVRHLLKKNHVPHSSFYHYKLSFFLFRVFFRVVLTGKCFCERTLAFVKRMLKKGFCTCLHASLALIPGLASSPVKPFLTLHFQFFAVLVQLQHYSNLFLVNLPQNLEHFSVLLL